MLLGPKPTLFIPLSYSYHPSKIFEEEKRQAEIEKAQQATGHIRNPHRGNQCMVQGSIHTVIPVEAGFICHCRAHHEGAWLCCYSLIAAQHNVEQHHLPIRSMFTKLYMTVKCMLFTGTATDQQ